MSNQKKELVHIAVWKKKVVKQIEKTPTSTRAMPGKKKGALKSKTTQIKLLDAV